MARRMAPKKRGGAGGALLSMRASVGRTWGPLGSSFSCRRFGMFGGLVVLFRDFFLGYFFVFSRVSFEASFSCPRRSEPEGSGFVDPKPPAWRLRDPAGGGLGAELGALRVRSQNALPPTDMEVPRPLWKDSFPLGKGLCALPCCYFPPVGFKGNLSLLNIFCIFFPGGLSEWRTGDGMEQLNVTRTV